MKIIVGLGNPGKIYAETRHNIGFMTVRALARSAGSSFKRSPNLSSLISPVQLKGRSVLLAMPLTFMNLSGGSVKKLLNKYKVSLDDLLVVCDDLDLEFGRLKIRPLGSSGGHNGLESIIDFTGSNKFCRLRIGIGRPEKGQNAADFVLDAFGAQEKRLLKQTLDEACQCCRVWATEGITRSMNIFNKRKPGAC